MVSHVIDTTLRHIWSLLLLSSWFIFHIFHVCFCAETCSCAKVMQWTWFTYFQIKLFGLMQLQQKRQLKGGRQTQEAERYLWSWAWFWDRNWPVTCSRCYWLNLQGLWPDPQRTAACTQKRDGERSVGILNEQDEERGWATCQCMLCVVKLWP